MRDGERRRKTVSHPRGSGGGPLAEGKAGRGRDEDLRAGSNGVKRKGEGSASAAQAVVARRQCLSCTGSGSAKAVPQLHRQW